MAKVLISYFSKSSNTKKMAEYIKEGLVKKGFSVIEMISPCPTNYGKYNKMGDLHETLKWLKDKGVSPEEYTKLSENERDECFQIGKFCDRDIPDFNTRYEEIRTRALNS